MKKATCLILALSVLYACTPKTELPERIMEDGVEVVLNRLEPYTIKGKPSTFTLQKEFSIDTEDDATAQLGLTDIGLHFDVDSEANVYLTTYQNTEGMVYKFDSSGNFVRSFLRKGQGPGSPDSFRQPARRNQRTRQTDDTQSHCGEETQRHLLYSFMEHFGQQNFHRIPGAGL